MIYPLNTAICSQTLSQTVSEEVHRECSRHVCLVRVWLWFTFDIQMQDLPLVEVLQRPQHLGEVVQGQVLRQPPPLPQELPQ